ncbi:DM13 domain-containing protein [Planktotalea sp.]|uniref:DM13 domain-containing protein n=1 Tax=Planktotalea sp. TaxID=2029877 RepID=UPI0025E2F636|nr:DM13 domain-containing protein [Planktotalea sp.]
MRRIITFLVTHGVAVALGLALGIYLLPILTAPSSPDAAMLEQKAGSALFKAELTRELRGSDFLHWGEGTISVSADDIVHEGKLAPGPDYMVYLTSEFVEDEAEFEAIKSKATLVGPVKTFGGFLLNVPDGVDVSNYNTVFVWCESFGEFITAVKYR